MPTVNHKFEWKKYRAIHPMQKHSWEFEVSQSIIKS
jgi:hypothetical protein